MQIDYFDQVIGFSIERLNSIFISYLDFFQLMNSQTENTCRLLVLFFFNFIAQTVYCLFFFILTFLIPILSRIRAYLSIVTYDTKTSMR